MPGLVSIKSPPESSSTQITIPNEEYPLIRNSNEDSDTRSTKLPSPSPRKAPSPATSRSKTSSDRNSNKKKNLINDESSLDNPDLGPFLLKLARDTIASGESPTKALDYAIRASKSFERCATERSLDFAMSLHVVAAICCSLGRFDEAVTALERGISVPDVERGMDHALAAFSGYMQLGDTRSMLGQLDKSIECYETGLKIQMETLGESDPRVAETCRYLAETYLQAMQFEKAETLCHKTLEIHKEHSAPASLEEATDRRLMALIYEAKGEYELALEHLVLASMAMLANSQDSEVAAIDVNIGDIYLSLGRFDESVFAYQKALTVFKSTKGDNHPLVASVFVRLADLYYKTGKFRESKSYCENALRIYNKPVPGTTSEEIAGGLTEISAIYEAVNESEEALKLLQRAMKLLDDVPGQRSTIAGIEAQMGVIHYMVGRYGDARNCFKSSITKLRACGERKSAFFGVILNQMGLACVQLYKIDEATELFEEAKVILEQECGRDHPDTLGVYSNLAATYDAMGRVEEAIEILERVLRTREEKLGTANPEVDDEKRRLAELLKEAGRMRNRKAKSLEILLDSSNTQNRVKKEGTRRWSALGFKS